MKKFLVFLCALGLLFGLVGFAHATPMVYYFEGQVSAVGTDPTGIIAAQGLSVGSTVTYSVLIDLAAPGSSTQNNGNVWLKTDTGTVDFFFADYISGSLLPGGGAYVGLTNYGEYNFGYQRIEPTVDYGLLQLGNSDSLLGFFAPLDVSDWAVGTLVKVNNNVYAPNPSGGVLTSIMIANNVQLKSITPADVPEPGTLLLLGSGLAGLGILGRRRKKLHN